MSTPLSYPDFTAQFAPHSMPALLQQLFELEQRQPDKVLAEGFYLRCIVQDQSGIRSYSTNPAFAASFIEFANASYTGSTYACWLIADTLELCPIVAFGDEGGIRVVAENLSQLLHLLTYDAEPMIDWESATYYRDEDESDRPHSDRRDEFTHWVKEQLQLNPVTTYEEAVAIVSTAETKYQQRLNEFLAQNGIEL